MIKTLFKVFIPAALFGYVVVACEVSPVGCDEDQCGPNGECVESECVCLPGYTGDNCDEIINQQFFGAYDANRQCDGFEVEFSTMTLSQGQYAFNVVLGNFANKGVDIQGTLLDNQLVIDFQTVNVPNEGDLSVSGSGTMVGNELTVNCSYYPPNQTGTTCVIYYTKQ